MVLDLINLTSESEIDLFLEQGHRVVLLYSPTCPPCQRLKPHLFEDLALLPQTVHLGYLNAKKYAHLKPRFKAVKIPFLVVFQNFQIQDSLQDSDIDIVHVFLNRLLNLGLPEIDMDDEDF